MDTDGGAPHDPTADAPRAAAAPPPDQPTHPPRRHGRHYPLWASLAVLVAVMLVLAAIGLFAVAVRPAKLATAPAGPFYTAPVPLTSGPPGTIIRSQPITAGVPAGAQAWRILYLSTAFDTNAPIAVSGVVWVPNGTAPNGGRPVVAWSHPTTGVVPSCAPSLADDGGASTVPGLASFLQAGYVVVATDYPGLGTQGPHPYLVGTSEAWSVLDSVRAARLLPGSGAGNRFVVWGHSQGGQSALFTGQLAASYAPDLSLAGVAAAAPATDLGALLNQDLGTLTGNVLASMAITSWSNVYPGARMSQLVGPEQAKVAVAVANRCINNSTQLIEDLPEAEYLKVRFVTNDPRTTPPWSTLLVVNTPGAAPTPAPLLITQGTADTVVDPNVTASFVQKLCGMGEQVEFQTLEGTNHTEAGFNSAPAVVLWTQDRFNGVAAPSNCSPPTTTSTTTGTPTSTVTTTATPATAAPSTTVASTSTTATAAPTTTSTTTAPTTATSTTATSTTTTSAP